GPGSAVAGLRPALEPGRGRTAVPVRSAMAGAVVAIVALVAALTFGASLRGLVDRPRLYGWDWDKALFANAGYGNMNQTRLHELLYRDRDAAAWTGGYSGSIELDGRKTAVLGGATNAARRPP